MRFDSSQFLLGFLPIAVVGHLLLARAGIARLRMAWLALCSLVFYGWWQPYDVPILIGSVLFNFTVSRILLRDGIAVGRKRFWFLVGIGGNLALLGYLSYFSFLVRNINIVTEAGLPLRRIVPPLAISFFTLQHLAFLVDCRQGKGARYPLLEYSVFGMFFPQLLVGPIVHHREMMPQYLGTATPGSHRRDLAAGLFLMAVGLAKKVLIADTFAIWVEAGFGRPDQLDTLAAWLCVSGVVLRFYFELSGYTDIALGAARLFGVQLPENFDSPGKATSVEDFWKRWHLTLGRWMHDYVFVPLGGEGQRSATHRRNMWAMYLLIGLWYGPRWTCVLFGATHAAALGVSRLWARGGFALPKLGSRAVTYGFLHLSFVFLQAGSLTTAQAMFRALLGLNEAATGPADLESSLALIQGGAATVPLLLVFHGVALFAPSASQLARRFKPNLIYLAAFLLLAAASLAKMVFLGDLAGL